MIKFRTIAIDDEPLALDMMAGYIEKTPFLELVGAYDNPIDALEVIKEQQIQLIFLDIQMPDLSGTQFARTLGPEVKVIFSTAYEQYALEGFQLEALDYLLKPISYEAFLKSANRARNHFEMVQKAQAVPVEEVVTNSDYLFIKADYKVQRINYDEILYFEGLKDYVKVYTTQAETPIVFHATMKAIENKVPKERFMRVHRSYIVNLDKVNTVERYRIVFGKERIPVSDLYKEQFNEFLNKNFL
ncbi:DNA-binding response regulator [Marinilabiliaceae bacterium JC017]|nr:DNA-binding response regulator [Marinilabiliaceae bacterium JC017]